MGLKKKGKKKKKDSIDSRPKGSSRAALALQIAKTDTTFELDELNKRYVGKCIHCGTSLVVMSETGSTAATIEHIFPLVAGGSGTDLMNLALSCSRCNNQKGIHHDARQLDERGELIVDLLLRKRASRFRYE